MPDTELIKRCVSRRRLAFGAVVKPAGAACNLSCAYCYYLHKESLPDGPGVGRMTEEALDEYIYQYLEGNESGEVVFTWHGGEPALLGLDFFRKVVEIQRKYAREGQRIANDLQTNGTLLDDAWCQFLKEHRFLVGLSLDGPREFHDRYRRDKHGEPTFDRVFAAAQLLRKHGVYFNTLSVVNRETARHPREVYRFLTREVGSIYLQFLPCVEPVEFAQVAPQRWDLRRLPKVGQLAARPETPDSVVTDWSVDPDDYGRFLCEVFDTWYARDLGRHWLQLVETLVSQRAGLGTQMCVFNDFCGKAIAVEHDGSVYSCDHYVYPEYRLGDIWKDSLADLVASERQIAFGLAKRRTLPRYCRACPFLADCWGECPRNRFLRAPDGEAGLNYLCRGYRQFFAHVGPRVDHLAAEARGATRGSAR
jgi:uncharacterized protein